MDRSSNHKPMLKKAKQVVGVFQKQDEEHPAQTVATTHEAARVRNTRGAEASDFEPLECIDLESLKQRRQEASRKVEESRAACSAAAKAVTTAEKELREHSAALLGIQRQIRRASSAAPPPLGMGQERRPNEDALGKSLEEEVQSLSAQMRELEAERDELRLLCCGDAPPAKKKSRRRQPVEPESVEPARSLPVQVIHLKMLICQLEREVESGHEIADRFDEIRAERKKAAALEPESEQY